MEIMIVILVIVAIYVLSGIKVVNQYQRGVVLTLGKFTGVREPGLRVVVPIFQTMMMVDVRSRQLMCQNKKSSPKTTSLSALTR